MKNQKFLSHFTAAVAGLLFLIFTVSAQETVVQSPTPQPVKVARKQSPRRISNVKMTEVEQTQSSAPRPNAPDGEQNTVQATPKIDPEIVEREKQAENDRRAAADAALEREKAKAVAEATKDAEAKAKIEADAKLAEFEAQKAELAAKQKEFEEAAAAEKKRLADELEQTRLESQNQAAEIRKKAEEEKAAFEQQAALEKSRLEAERAEIEKKAETERQERERKTEEERLLREKADETERVEREQKAAEERELIERQTREAAAQAAAQAAALQLEIDNQRQAAEAAQQKADAENAARLEIEAKAKIERDALRKSMIEQVARGLNYVSPEAASTLVPEQMTAADEIENFLSESAKKNQSLVANVDYCNTGFKGEAFTYTGTADITLGDFLDQLSERYSVDFVPDSDVLNLPIRLSVNNKPWDKVLRQQLNLLDVQATCDGGIISLVKRTKYLAQQESNRKTAPLKTERIVLQHLRVRASSQVDLSGKQNSTDPIITLEQTLQKILQTGGDTRGTVAQVPGRAEFFIKATEDQLREIREQISLADRPRYRVDVFGLIYTVNENKLKDVGSQLSAVLSNGGGLTTLPPVQQSGGTGTGTTQTNNFPGGFSPPSGSLGAGGASTIIGAQVNVGIFDFRYQLSLLEQFGVARSIEKPFVSAKDGTTSVYDNGTKIPVVIQALNNFGGGSGGSISYINAGTVLSVSPQIAFDGDDKPRSVSLNMRLESNTPNTAIQTNGDIPAVNTRSIQLDDVTLIPGQAFIFGGSNNRLESNTVSRTPGLGGLPFLGNLFKRTNKQINDEKIYFAVTVQISEDNGTPPVNPFNLDTTFQAPPAMNQPLKPTKIK